MIDGDHQNLELPDCTTISVRATSAPSPQSPPQPPQAIGKQRPSWQMPKTLFFPVQRVVTEILDRGWMGTAPLRRHIVMCGFPRSGTTLCQLMVESCVDGLRTFGRERRALEVARYAFRNQSLMLSKRPSDIFLIESIRNFYRNRSADVRFVVFSRDPRAILTSVHKTRPGEYYVSVDRWRAMHEHWQWACGQPDVLSVRYEDIVSNPQQLERRLTDFVGWSVARPFSEFQSSIPGRFDTLALNGVRQLDASNADRWRQPQFAARISQLLCDELPELPGRLVEMGYEPDARWLQSYAA